MLLATIFSALTMIFSFVWYCVLSYKRLLKFWEASFMYVGMIYGAIDTGLFLSTLL